MLPPFLHRLTAWLCLAVALFSGLAPARGLVVCLEPDGCMSIEVTADGKHCGGCEAHQSPSNGGARSVSAASSTGCPCIDLAVSVATENQKVLSKSVDFPVAKWVALRPLQIGKPWGAPSIPLCSRLFNPPRPPDSLLLIRSVVLLV